MADQVLTSEFPLNAVLEQEVTHKRSTEIGSGVAKIDVQRPIFILATLFQPTVGRGALGDLWRHFKRVAIVGPIGDRASAKPGTATDIDRSLGDNSAL
jgi:hypothetical protein